MGLSETVCGILDVRGRKGQQQARDIFSPGLRHIITQLSEWRNTVPALNPFSPRAAYGPRSSYPDHTTKPLGGLLNWTRHFRSPGSLSAMTFTLLQINSDKCSSSNGASFDVRNPLTNKVVGRAASATRDDCFAAISSAAAAFTSWQNSAVSERQNIFQSAIHLLQTPQYEQEMVTAFQEELGVTPLTAEFNWRISIVFLTVLLDALKTVKEPETHDSAVVPGAKVTVTRKPLGVMQVVFCYLRKSFSLSFLLQSFVCTVEPPRRPDDPRCMFSHYIW